MMGRGSSRIFLRGLFEAGFPEGPDSGVSGEFQALHPGVDILPLYGPDPEDLVAMSEQPSAALIRYQAGATVPLHEHTGYEHILVLSGSQSDENGTYSRGCCVMNPPGSRHSVRSNDGCLVLAIWDHPIALL
jgi:anti-sigma factor ChrR (cupin superfamily)